MFDHLTARLSRTIENLRGRGRITDENVAETLREARVALLKRTSRCRGEVIIESVRAKALGAEVLASLTPGQGVHRYSATRAGAAHGRIGHALEAARATSGGAAAGGPAGRRQDHPPRRSSRAG